MSPNADPTSTDFFDVALRQRAHRRFTDEPVSDEVLAKLLEAATRAPSSENIQPWRFVIVRDASNREAIGQLIKEIWLAGGREHTEGRASTKVFEDVDRALGGGELADAPVLLVVGGDTDVLHRSVMKSSVFPAIQSILLGATALGLGSCLTTIATLRADEMRELAGFPPHIDPLSVIPIGHPVKPLGPPKRDELGTKVSSERYGQPWTPPS